MPYNVAFTVRKAEKCPVIRTWSRNYGGRDWLNRAVRATLSLA